MKPVPKIIAVMNQKGGVGKTTTSVNLAHGLSQHGRRALLIDLDSQGSASLALGLDPAPATRRLLLGGEPLSRLVTPVRDGLDLLASDDSLADVRDWLAVRSARDARSAILALARALDSGFGERAEGQGPKEGRAPDRPVVVIDCGPGLDILSLNALMAATDVLVPVSVDYLSAAGARQHLDTLAGLQEMGSQARLSWVVPTFYDARLNRAREILALLQQTFGDLLTHPIRTNTRLAEAPHHGQTIFEFDPRSSGADDYAELTRRVVEHEQA